MNIYSKADRGRKENKKKILAVYTVVTKTRAKKTTYMPLPSNDFAKSLKSPQRIHTQNSATSYGFTPSSSPRCGPWLV